MTKEQEEAEKEPELWTENPCHWYWKQGATESEMRDVQTAQDNGEQICYVTVDIGNGKQDIFN